jgi:predicted transcriptional regulator YdeE/DNA-binding transcriptional MerR regulator
MIKIGDFSKLAHVTIKTLHHYGELGLFKPAHIDRYTGYRYYTLEQLSQLNRILALKNLGFSLDQTALLLSENLSVPEIRGMLRLKQIELAGKIESEQARLAQVEIRLKHLEGEGSLPGDAIAIKEIASMFVLSARAVAATETAIQPARESLQELLQHNLDRARLKPIGPWFALMDDLSYSESDLEVEMAVPVKPGRSTRAGDWEGTPVILRELPAVNSMASVIHEGEYHTVNRAYTGLYAWTQANSFKITGSCREVYLPETGLSTIPDPDIFSGFIEVQCPVERVRIPISIITPTANRKEKIMEPRVIKKTGMKVVGLSYVGKNENNEIPQMWAEWNARSGEIKNQKGFECFGACFSNPEGAKEGEFEYVACIEVSDATEIPPGMVQRQIPEYSYAVFTHRGKLDTLHDTYKYIWETLLPQSGLEVHDDKFDMELYDDRFDPNSDESAFDILVAIKG